MTRKIVPGIKDDSGAYLPAEPRKASEEVSLDSILGRQLQALDEVTTQLLGKAKSGFLNRDEIQSLATCIKVTLELKLRENELLEDLSDEDLEKIAKS